MKRISIFAFALTLAGAPALAGGYFSWQYNAKNAEEARAIRAGLAMYSVAKAIESGADIHQIGRDNMAGIGQFGQGNVGIIDQHGNNHTASLTQNGNNNAYGIFQHGAGAISHVVQTGDYGVGITVQYGW